MYGRDKEVYYRREVAQGAGEVELRGATRGQLHVQQSELPKNRHVECNGGIRVDGRRLTRVVRPIQNCTITN